MTLKINGATGGSVSIDAPDNTSPSGTDVTLTLPTSAGSSGQYLQTNGTGTLSWQTVASDAITEGNTTVECVDTGSDGHITFDTEGSERARFDSSGRLLIGRTSSQSENIEGVGYANIVQIEGSATGAGLSVANNADAARINISRDIASDNITTNMPLGFISFGAESPTTVERARIQCDAEFTNANERGGRLKLYTSANGNHIPTERMRITQAGGVRIPHAYSSTTSNAANVFIYGDGELARSTSSQKYKTQIEPVEYSYSAALLDCQPVWYRSTCEKDNPDWGWWGFIAEEVAKIDPRLVHWKTVEVSYDEQGSMVESPCDPEPEGVAYDRFVPHLLNIIKSQKEQLETQAASIASLEARLTALEGGAA